MHVGLSDGRSRRLTTLGPGVAFGEMALLDGDNRSAEVRADTPVIVYALAVGALGQILPSIQAVILVNIGRMLSQRLSKANDEIRSWE